MKFDRGKARFDLLNWGALQEIAEVMADGAITYGDRNWEDGMHYGRVFSAMMRHGAAWAMGEEMSNHGHRHLAHVGACCLMLMGLTVEYPALDDRSKLVAYNTVVLGELPDGDSEEATTTES